MYQPKVSIIIPVFNGGDFLAQSIESALSQTYSNVEIIVVNDGSEDEGSTDRIALKYCNSIRYFSKENGGVSSALNYGITKMEGEWFSWLSHDDLYLPNKIFSQIQLLSDIVCKSETGNIVDLSKIVLYSNTDFINDKNEIILKLKPFAKPLEDSRDIILKNIQRNRLGGCSFLIHRDVFNKVGFFNESIRTVSDYDFWYRLLLNDYHFIYIPKTLVLGRIHRKQVSFTSSSLGRQELEDFHTDLIRKLQNKNEYRNDANMFLKLGYYSCQRGYFASANEAFEYYFSLNQGLYPLIKVETLKNFSRVNRLYRKYSRAVYNQLFVK